MTDPDETVWVVAQADSGGKRKLHTDPECSTLNSRRDSYKKKRSTLPNHEVCKQCEGYEHYSPQESTNSTRHRLLDTSPEDIGLSPPEGDLGD